MTDTDACRVLVTGAGGFIGSHLVEALLACGHDVLAADRRFGGKDLLVAGSLAEVRDHPGLSLTPADLITDDLDGLLAGRDVVFHLAALAGVRSSWGVRFGEYVAANILATHRLLAACEASGVRRLVYASSSSVYGPAASPSRETDATGPISPYGVSKLAAEQLCLAHARRPDTNLTVAALRYFTVYGPRQRPDMLLGRLLAAALAGTPVTVFGDGNQRREFTYVSDVVTATMQAAGMEVRAAVVNIGGGASVSVAEVLRLAEEVTGRPVPVVHASPQAGDVPATQADLQLARRLLGYRPVVDLATGLARQADWLAGLPEPLLARWLPDQPEVTA